MRTCKWCGLTTDDLHEVQEARGWPGEYACRNILACQTRRVSVFNVREYGADATRSADATAATWSAEQDGGTDGG